MEAPRRRAGLGLASSSSSVRPLTTDSGRSAVTSEPGSAASSRRLISSHCAFSPGRVRWSAKPPFSFVPCSTNTACPRVERLGPRDAPALLVAALVPDDRAAGSARVPSKGSRSTSWSATSIAIRLTAGSIDGPFGTAQRAHHAVDLEPQVEVPRRGGVLLDDEPPGADAADRELLVTFDLQLLDVDRFHVSQARPAAQELHELVDVAVAAPSA